MVVKVNVGDAECDWLLKIHYRNTSGIYESRFVQYWNKTEEEIMAIVDSYRSYDTVIRIYKLWDVL